jgi:hypothetical protein
LKGHNFIVTGKVRRVDAMSQGATLVVPIGQTKFTGLQPLRHALLFLTLHL